MALPITNDQLPERIRIEDVMLRERAARDGGRWDEMARAYHPDAEVEVSWYRGNVAGFIQGSKAMAASGACTFHVIGQSICSIRGDRALLDTDCTLHGFFTLDGCEVDIVGFGRMQWRMQRLDSAWLIAGLRGLYVRDMLMPVSPGRLLALDDAHLDALRPSYRHLAYVSGAAGRPVPGDLPGIDRPDLVAALREGEQAWLAKG